MSGRKLKIKNTGDRAEELVRIRRLLAHLQRAIQLVILSGAQRSRRIPRFNPGFGNGIPRLRSERQKRCIASTDCNSLRKIDIGKQVTLAGWVMSPAITVASSSSICAIAKG